MARDGSDRDRDKRSPAHRDDDTPVLPDVTSDEHDVGWGDEPSKRDDEWYRKERPPHHE
jgi:hypothetical protein